MFSLQDDNSEKKLHSTVFWNHLQDISEAWDLEGITEKLLETVYTTIHT